MRSVYQIVARSKLTYVPLYPIFRFMRLLTTIWCPVGSWVERATRELLRGEGHRGSIAEGISYWVYVAIKPSNYKAFLQATADQQLVHYNNYGTILKYGFEEEVPSAIKEEMKLKYSFDENYVQWLAQDVQKAQGAFLAEQKA